MNMMFSEGKTVVNMSAQTAPHAMTAPNAELVPYLTMRLIPVPQ